jgi:IS30 family transposase
MKLTDFERALVRRWQRWGMSQREVAVELREYRWQRDNYSEVE